MEFNNSSALSRKKGLYGKELIQSLEKAALEIRKNLLTLCEQQVIHIGGDLSVADVMTVLWQYQMRYDPADPKNEARDRFVLSKGHAAAVTSFNQAAIGCYDTADIFKEYASDNGRFAMHSCNLINPHVEVSTGSLGHGLPVAAGLAQGLKLKGNTQSRVYVVMGDGEQSEGSMWEAIMNAVHCRLGNLIGIAFPVVDFDDNVPLMLQCVAGNITALPHVKLLDLDLPRSLVAKFKGPKFGIQGIRDLLGVYDRPILNNMIKPCTGYTPEIGAELFYATAAGGVDFIKDDELMAGNLSFNHIEDRVRMNMAAAEKANKLKGEKTLYTCNVTGEFKDLKENAMRAIRAGTNGIMIDVYTAGLSGLRMLAEDPEINVPILAHPGGVGAVCVSPYQGVSHNVLAKLARLCGADIQLVANPYGKFDAMAYPSVRTLGIMRNKLYDIKPTLPLFGGGTIPGNIPMILHDVGIDCIMGAGAAVHAFPMGPTKGAQALRASITATLKGIPLREAAKNDEALQCAIDTWGIVGESDVKKNFLI